MWIREVVVHIGNKTFRDDEIDIDFSIPFGTKAEPNISELHFYNLSNSTINNIKKGDKVIVNAGYKRINNIGNILTGKVEDIETNWQGVDKKTTLLVSDGAVEWRNTILNKTYKQGTKASFIMRDLANYLGYEVVEISPVDDLTYLRGKTISGNVAEYLQQLVNETNSKMFINKNRLVIRASERGYQTGFILNSQSGLLGSPTRQLDDGKTRWNVNTLLNPLLEPDGQIEIQSKIITGRFRIIEGTHRGNFTTELLVEEV